MASSNGSNKGTFIQKKKKKKKKLDGLEIALDQSE